MFNQPITMAANKMSRQIKFLSHSIVNVTMKFNYESNINFKGQH